MKRIEFIAPVEAMRGNLSGTQKLEYPTNNNAAYEGPVGSVNYARNYGARFIGAKIAKSGKKYFTVRTKSANHLTAKSKKAMALLAGAGAIYAALIKATALKAQAEAVFAKAQVLGDSRSFRKFMMDYIRAALIEHKATITLNIAGTSVSIDNPWGKFSGSLNITISDTIRIKFWNQLVSNPVEFTIDGMKGVSIGGDSFVNVINGNYNNLGLSLATEAGAEGLVKMGGQYLVFTQGDTVYGAYASRDVAENGATGIETKEFNLSDTPVEYYDE